MGPPQLLFGGAAIASGRFSSAKEVMSLLELLKTLSISHIDIAPTYPMTSPGKAEQLLGECEPGAFTIDTKIMVTSMTGKGTLTTGAIEKSITSSLERLKAGVNILYCHMPDPETPIAETAAALDRHYRAHNFKKLGLSNFSAGQVQAYIDVCEQEGYVKPRYFQGQYNAICRNHEKDLMALLRKHHMYYIAYSPIAGGFLSGVFTQGTQVAGTRFEEGNKAGSFYKRMYDKPVMHEAIERPRKSCEGHGISLTDAALRWLCYHSALGDADGVILGASKEDQVQHNVTGISKGPLPEDIRALFEKTWKDVEAEAP